VVRGTTRRRFTRPSDFPLDRGDRVRICTGGGGGWGEPQARDPAAVAGDVRDGFVTIKEAAAIYGVVIDQDAQKVDLPATDELRAKRWGGAR
jgi:N-methylhydantoinase B